MSFYAYDLSENLISQLIPYSGRIEQPPPDLTPSSDPSPNGLTCTYCGLINTDSSTAREHYRKDFHKLNIKRKVQNLPPLSEDEFEKQIGELDESLSGSDESSEDDTDKVDKLFEKASLSSINEDDDEIDDKQNKPGSPYAFFSLVENATYKLLSIDNTLAIYKNLLDPVILDEDPIRALTALQSKSTSHSIVLMIGGGHFAGAVVSHQKPKKRGLLPNSLDNVNIITHKSFHRYTTRRKQGGAQSASDNARGKASSAGSSLRRYNEQALEQEIHELLDSWKGYISNCDNIYIRASGRSNKGILMNYTKAPIISSDKRIKNLPFTTGRATTSELKRAWMELTNVKVISKSSLVDNTPKKKLVTKEDIKRQLEKSKATPSRSTPPPAQLSVSEKHTNELISLIKKSRSPRLIAYLKSNNLSPDFELQPSSTYLLTPNLLFYASSQGSHHIITTLLSLSGDPTIKNKSNRTAYEIASDTATTDAFQLARSTLGEDKWDWKAAKVGPPLTKEDISARIEKEKLENEEKRRNEVAKLESEEAEKRLEKTISKHGAGKVLSSNILTSISEGSRGLSEEAKAKLERERRARAAEARFKK